MKKFLVKINEGLFLNREICVINEISAQNLDQILEQMCVWKDKFLHSPEFQVLSESEQDEASVIVLNLGEYMYSFQGLSPSEWQEEALENCCLEDFPAKMVAETAFFESLSGVLAAFFKFLSREKYLPQAASLSQTAVDCAAEIQLFSQDPARWSQEKFLIIRAALDGHDLEDLEDMDSFVHSYEEQFQVFSHF
jgi:hypothetical protein